MKNNKDRNELSMLVLYLYVFSSFFKSITILKCHMERFL